MNTELVQIRCKSLRSKSSYGVFDDSDEEILQLTGSTATYWCLKTMSKAGPDSHFVHRSVCNEGRMCWESCED
jgi:hypothetical protein